MDFQFFHCLFQFIKNQILQRFGGKQTLSLHGFYGQVYAEVSTFIYSSIHAPTHYRILSSYSWIKIFQLSKGLATALESVLALFKTKNFVYIIENFYPLSIRASFRELRSRPYQHIMNLSTWTFDDQNLDLRIWNKLHFQLSDLYFLHMQRFLSKPNDQIKWQDYNAVSSIVNNIKKHINWKSLTLFSNSPQPAGKFSFFPQNMYFYLLSSNFWEFHSLVLPIIFIKSRSLIILIVFNKNLDRF